MIVHHNIQTWFNYGTIFQLFATVLIIDILYTLDSASLLGKLKPRIFQRLPSFE